jgi:hypothetical protein
MAFEEPDGDEQRTGKFAVGEVGAQRAARHSLHALQPLLRFRMKHGTGGNTVGALTTRRDPCDP